MRFGSAIIPAFGSNIRWGILSTGKISSDFVNAISITEGAACAGVAARNVENASSFAKKHNIPKYYHSYEDLLSDDSIDVVYVGSIADQHSKMTKMCLKAGRPTVCEKPLTLNAKDTREIIELARSEDVFLLEGLWSRFFPAMKKVSELIRDGEIGTVVNVQGDFGYNNLNFGLDDRIWKPSSGGMTYDIGMYLAHLGQVAYPGAEVEMIQTMATMKNGVDQTTLCNMMWSYGDDTVDDETGQKGMLQYYVTGSANTEERVTIQGTNGRIVVHSPAHVRERVSLFKDEGRGKSSETVFDFPLPKDDWTTWNYPNSIGFTYEIQHVNEALRAGKKECDEFTWRDSIQLAEIVDEILKQAKSRDVFCATKRYEEQAELVTK